MTNYSIKRTDSRDRMWRHLEDATGEGNTSAALDVAARYYLRMAGDTGAHPVGVVEDLLDAAEERGSLTAAEIADVLDAPELPVEYHTARAIGRD